MELTGDDAGNYTVTEVVTAPGSGIDVVIRKAEVTLSVVGAVDGTVTEGYTGEKIDLKAKIEDEVFDETLRQEDVDFTFKQGGIEKEPITRGTYDVTVSLKEEAADRYPNFNIQRGGCTLEITNASLTVEPEGYTGTYTGFSHNVLESWSFTSTTGKPVDAGNVTVTFQLVGADNADGPDADGTWLRSDSFVNASQSGSYWYQAEYESHNTVYGEQPVQIAIDPAPLTLDSSLSVTEKTYDGTTDIHEDNGTLVSEVTGIVEKDKSGVSIKVEAAYVSPNAGTPNIEVKYTFAFTGGVLPGNYQYGDAPLAEGAVLTQTVLGTIDKAPLTIELKPQHSVYNGRTPAPQQGTDWWSVAETGGTIYSQNGEPDDLGITLEITGAKADADTYPLTATPTGTDSGNYEVQVTDSTYTVDKRPVTIQIGDAAGVYGDDPDLSTVTLEDVTPKGDDAGLVDDMSDVVTADNLSTTVTAASDAGTTGDITAIPTGSKADNYDITWQSGTYTQNKRSMTVTLTNQEGIYGQEHTAAQDKFTLEEADRSNTVVQGDRTGKDLTFTLTVDADSDSPVGAYDISGAVDGNKAGNYLITWTGEGNEIPGSNGQKYGKYTVEQAGLEIGFTYGNQVTNGVSINITDTYDSNALELENETTGTAVSDADKGTLDIVYAIGPAGGGSGDVSAICGG